MYCRTSTNDAIVNSTVSEKFLHDNRILNTQIRQAFPKPFLRECR